MSYRIIRTSEPSVEPVSLVEAKNHLRVDSGADDSLISSLITAARQLAEHRTQRCFIQSNYSLYLDAFTDEIVLPFPPLLSIMTFLYYDGNNTEQTVSDSVYRIVSGIEPAIVTTEYGQSWPTARVQKDSIVIAYKAGYSSAASAVPVGIKQAILLLVEFMYANRGTESTAIPIAVDALLSQYEHGYRW